MWCDSNLDLQSNLPRLGARLINLTSFFLWKNVAHCFRILKVTKALLYYKKNLGLLGLYVIVKGIISSFFAVFSCLKISGDISLALNMLASLSESGYFCSSNVFSVL